MWRASRHGAALIANRNRQAAKISARAREVSCRIEGSYLNSTNEAAKPHRERNEADIAIGVQGPRGRYEHKLVASRRALCARLGRRLQRPSCPSCGDVRLIMLRAAIIAPWRRIASGSSAKNLRPCCACGREMLITPRLVIVDAERWSRGIRHQNRLTTIALIH